MQRFISHMAKITREEPVLVTTLRIERADRWEEVSPTWLRETLARKEEEPAEVAKAMAVV